MLRGENIICGTSTTGTGTLTLAATPTPPGGVDFDVLARTTGIGFGNSAAILCTYTIIEYTDSTFATAKSMEKGIGTLTLGGSSGVANATLVRTTVQVTATSMNSQPATYNTNAPSAVSIGTAANTLVFIGASAADIIAYLPYFETSLGDNLGAAPMSAIGGSGTGAGLVTAKDFYQCFHWCVPMLVKRASMRVATAYTGGSPVSNAYARIYDIGSNARPGKLLIDFGLLGSANVSLNSTGNISSALHSTGYFLTPGEYFFDFLPIYSGGSSGPNMNAPASASGGGYVTSGRLGSTSLQPYVCATATGGVSTAPDPANVTGYAEFSGYTNCPYFTLSTS